MEYERIHKVQTGIISPSKLRMKLIGLHHQRKKDGSVSNSSRTSPSKLEDGEFANNSLLADNSGDFDEEASSNLKVSSTRVSSNVVPDAGETHKSSCQCHPTEFLPRETVKLQQLSRSYSANSSSVHPMRTLEEENLDYDSNASSSSFEFHKGERSSHNPITRSVSRPMPSKWNDAEKWIVNKHNVQADCSKKGHLQSQANRLLVPNIVRVAPESASDAQKKSVKRVDFCQPTSQTHLEKFSFIPLGSDSNSCQITGANGIIDLFPQSQDLKEVDNKESNCTRKSCEENTALPAIRSVSMREMGTEMTPIPSQEPSRTATPIGATTPLRSPTSSIPSSPQRGAPAPTPNGQIFGKETEFTTQNSKRELSEQDIKLNTRKEIVALGFQLGKMNIAAWASKDEKDRNNSDAGTVDVSGLKQIEFEKRAAAWEEAEKSKHTARYKREELKIQVWESQQKAKLEEELRRIEAQVEQMRTQGQAKMVKKIAMARQKSEQKRAAAEARRDRQVEKTSAQTEYIRQTGQVSSSSYICCFRLS